MTIERAITIAAEELVLSWHGATWPEVSDTDIERVAELCGEPEDDTTGPDEYEAKLRLWSDEHSIGPRLDWEIMECAYVLTGGHNG